ncbi:MAG: transglycosylase SLT domain-containing protein [Acidobacteria bacterium]|nr:transglycosylase SLT domain-containing protein [Acidobacteriota bacterium]
MRAWFRRIVRAAVFSAAAGGLTWAVLHALLVEFPAPPSSVVQPKPVQRDLAAIRAEGVLRVAIPEDEIAAGEYDGRRDGMALELARRVSRRLGVRLETHAPATAAQGLLELARGTADVLAVIDSGPRPVVGKVAWTLPLDRARPVLAGRGAAGVRSVDDLAGRAISVVRHSALERRARAWQTRLGGRLDIVRLAPDLPVLELVAGARQGRWPAVLIDEPRARLEAALDRELELSSPLDEPLPVRWATRPNAPELTSVLTRSLEDARTHGVIAELARRYLEDPFRLRMCRNLEFWRGDALLTPWDGLIQHAAREHALDWRLLAAVAAVESGFDHRSVGEHGAVGMFQLLPRTAQAFGAEDPRDPAQNAAAGARHLRWLYDLLPGLPERDRLAFALAGYNMGLGHVEDARGLAASKGLDPDSWSDVASILPLMEDPGVAERLAHGMARGTLTRRYVESVLQRFDGYARAGLSVKTQAAG